MHTTASSLVAIEQYFKIFFMAINKNLKLKLQTTICRFDSRFDLNSNRSHGFDSRFDSNGNFRFAGL